MTKIGGFASRRYWRVALTKYLFKSFCVAASYDMICNELT